MKTAPGSDFGGIDLFQRWTDWVLQYLSSPKTDNLTGIDDKEIQNKILICWRRKRRLFLVGFASLVAAAYLYRRRMGRRSGNGSGVLLSLLMMLGWKRGKSSSNSYRRASEAPMSVLWNAAKQGNVQRALLLGSESAVAYQLGGTDTWKRSTLPPNSPNIQSEILEVLSKNGCTDVSALPESIWSKLATPAMAALPFVYLALLYRMMRNLHGKDDSARTHNEGSSRVTFEDVAGIDHAVTEVSEVVSYLNNPSAYHSLGARPPRAVLLYGPPGTGKTLLARAVAGEAHCDAFIACSGSDFVDTFVGRGAARVRTLFDQARQQAQGRKSVWRSLIFTTKPSTKVPSALIFIDECDALARSRGVFTNNEERDSTLNQLLTEMDGFAEHPEVNLIVIAATNRADVLDPAILRRFDRQVHVGYPDSKGRELILLVHAKRIQCRQDEIEWKHLARLTDKFSGADLKNLINDAALLAVRDGSPNVQTSHLERAVERVRKMKTTKEGSLPPHFASSFRNV